MPDCRGPFTDTTGYCVAARSTVAARCLGITGELHTEDQIFNLYADGSAANRLASPRTLMELEFVPLLGIQRDLYRLPRGRERFEAYLRTMVDSRTGDLALPLVDMNPMGKEHLPPLLDPRFERP